ncbi:hypothetical protein GMI69_09530 [Eggerthellaceae bacterium zg-887]|uniref:hypothetical protein n=1 Tax=Xiamenia xianingshaonis TaxID=2682776 RepID=UPI00140BF312|nr:hypothetical protein [Xiamenia xianingshaonis]NHM16882.1 hypothetical protein [Xiamenia xianingshaonis]
MRRPASIARTAAAVILAAGVALGAPLAASTSAAVDGGTASREATAPGEAASQAANPNLAWAEDDPQPDPANAGATLPDDAADKGPLNGTDAEAATDEGGTDAAGPSDQAPGSTDAAPGPEDRKLGPDDPAADGNSVDDFGLPAESPLFGGVEEPDVEEQPKSDKPAAPSTSEEAPKDDWLSDNNAVMPQQLPDSSFIYDTSIQDLSAADPYFDNQTVQVTGEVVGDSIRATLRGRYRWIVLSSAADSSTISVYLSEESAAKIDQFGRYGVRGTTLKVRGTFHLACAQHDGASDLHAEDVAVVSPGETVHETFDPHAFIPGAVLVSVGLAMMMVFYLLSERRR